MSNIATIAKYTFIEVYKSKILFNILLLGIALIIVSYVASEFSHGVQARVALDFGLGAMYLVVIGISIFIGVSLVSKEIESRTAYMILSRPIKRREFLIGKFCGMSLILFLNVFSLGIIIYLYYLFLGGDLNALFVWTLFFTFLEATIILLVVIFFSLVTNVTMSVIYAICIFILGHVLSSTILISFVKTDPVLVTILKIIKWCVPNLHKLNLRDYVIYKQFLPTEYYLTSFGYAIIYIMFLVFINVLVFERKELD